MQPRERAFDRFEHGVSRSRVFKFFLPVSQNAFDDRQDQAFAEVHHVLVTGVGDLRLDHPELGQMPARLRFFGTKCRAECIRFTERRGGRFVIKLAGLRQIRFLVAEVIDLEQRRRAFARGRREDRRVGKRKSVVVKIIAHGLDDRVPDFQNCVLLFRADPQMPVVHQEFGAVFLRRDRIIVHVLQDLDVLHVEFDADRRPRVFLYRPVTMIELPARELWPFRTLPRCSA